MVAVGSYAIAAAWAAPDEPHHRRRRRPLGVQLILDRGPSGPLRVAGSSPSATTPPYRVAVESRVNREIESAAPTTAGDRRTRHHAAGYAREGLLRALGRGRQIVVFARMAASRFSSVACSQGRSSAVVVSIRHGLPRGMCGGDQRPAYGRKSGSSPPPLSAARTPWICATISSRGVRSAPARRPGPGAGRVVHEQRCNGGLRCGGQRGRAAVASWSSSEGPGAGSPVERREHQHTAGHDRAARGDRVAARHRVLSELSR